MKILLIATLLITTVCYGQKSGRKSPDSSIVNFMQWLLQSDSSFKVDRHVSSAPIKWNKEVLRYSGHSGVGVEALENIFSARNGLISFVDSTESAWFVRQAEGKRIKKWKFKFRGVEIVDPSGMGVEPLDYTLFSYSTPLFTRNNKYALIIEAFYCGLVCGGGSFNLYQRQADNSWKKVLEFNQWAE